MNPIKDLIQTSLKKFIPPLKLTISMWADKYRVLSDTSAEKGRWNTDRAPFQREVMDTISDPNFEEVWCMFSAQVGKTEMELNSLGYFMHYEPCPILFVQPNEGAAEDFSKERIAPMIESVPELKRLFQDPLSSDSVLNKIFPEGGLGIAGANAPAGLASKPRRVVFFDEVDRFPASAGREGDPIRLAKKRTTTFLNRKIVGVSTPVNKETSRIYRAYLSGDQRKFKVPCPFCNRFQELKFSHVVYELDNPEDAQYKCESCEKMIDHSEKSEMLAKGFWEKENPSAKGIASFHLSELYSPWCTWGQVAKSYESAKENAEEYKVWLNTSMGEPYEHSGDAPEWKKLYLQRENYQRNKIPDGVYFLTVGVDVQRNRFELEILGHGLNRESYSIDYRIIPADTSRLESFQVLSDILHETFETSDGRQMPILKMAIDSGDQTQTVYAWVRSQSRTRVMAIKGGNEDLKVPLSTPSYVDLNFEGKREKNSIMLWTVGTWMLKRQLYGQLKIERPTEEALEEFGMPWGYCHFPNYDEKHFRGLCSEVEEIKMVNGYPRTVWTKIYQRNEPLDCRVYAVAAAEQVGISKMKEADFIKLKQAAEKISKL